MLGSAVQNVIALSDAVLLYHKGDVEFAAMGFVGVFTSPLQPSGFRFRGAGRS
jgi:hypothetical protein